MGTRRGRGPRWLMGGRGQQAASGLLHHLPLALIRHLREGGVQRPPPRLVDLVVVIGGVPAEELDEEKVDRLLNPGAVFGGVERVFDLSQRFHQPSRETGLFPNLAQRRVGNRLAGLDPPLGERPDDSPSRARASDERDVDAVVQLAEDDAAGGSLLDRLGHAPTSRSLSMDDHLLRCQSVLRAHVRTSTLSAQDLLPPCIWPSLNRLHYPNTRTNS